MCRSEQGLNLQKLIHRQSDVGEERCPKPETVADKKKIRQQDNTYIQIDNIKNMI